MDKNIYLCLAHMSEEGIEQKYVKEAFDTNWVVPLGPNVNAFEEDLKRFVGEGKEVVALSAGTAAVHLALLACGVGQGDEVIVQSFTFCASSHPVTYLGAVPVFVDSEKETWNMSPELLEEAIKDRIAKTGKKPKAIVPVALYGMPYDCTRIMEIADRYAIPVVEDAAEGFGSRFKGQVLGTFGKFGVLSFNGNKMITTSGGGALICKDAESKNQIMWYATQAREAYPYYQHEAIGYNYRMSNICAGIGRGQMTVADKHIAHHRHVQALYKELLKDVEGVLLHEAPSADYDSNFWLCTITLGSSLRIKGQENAYKDIVKTAVGGAAGVIHAVVRDVAGAGQEHGGLVGNQDVALGVGQLVPGNAVDSLVLADVDIVRIVGDVQIGAIGNVGVVLIGRGGNDLDFADLLGFGNGLLRPSTGLDVASNAVLHQVHGNHGELQGSAALDEEDLVVVRNVHQIAQVLLRLVDDLLIDLGAVGHFHDAHAGTSVVHHLVTDFFQYCLGHGRRTGGEVISAAVFHFIVPPETSFIMKSSGQTLSLPRVYRSFTQ